MPLLPSVPAFQAPEVRDFTTCRPPLSQRRSVQSSIDLLQAQDMDTRDASTKPARPQSQLRVPRLKYRQSLADVSTYETGLSGSDKSPTIDTFPPSLRAPSIVSGASSIPSESISSGPLSPAPSSTFSERVVEKKPKKRRSLFAGWLGTKEPSAKALIQYQEQLAGQAISKQPTTNLRQTIPGIAKTPLPPEAPRVDSRWKQQAKPSVKDNRKRLTLLGRRANSEEAVPSTQCSSSDPSTYVSFPRSSETLATSTRSTHTSGSSGSRNALAELYGWEEPLPSPRSFTGGRSFQLSRPTTPSSRSGLTAPPKIVGPDET